MKKAWIGRLAAALLALTLCGCTGTTGDETHYAPDEAHRLVLYTSHKEEVWLPVVTEFENRTGIFVEVVTGGTNELLGRIRQEAGAPRADVMFGGGVESLESYTDCFMPYRCASRDKLLPRCCSPEDLWTPFSSLPVVLIYNTKLVSPQELTGWQDLLSPRFTGRIAFTDPSISGSCFTALVTYLCAMDMEHEEAMQTFARQLAGRQLDSSGAVLTAVADGTDLVGVTLEETALKRIAAGDDIAMVYPVEGTSCVPDGSALIAGAPHSANAKRFLDFIAGQDVQQLLTDRFYRRSVRQDIAPAAQLLPLNQLPSVDYDVSWASQNRESLLSGWAALFDQEDAP